MSGERPDQLKITFELFYDPAQESIALVTDDARLTDENGTKPGFWVSFNANPRSADYHPSNFNRLARLLRAAGKPAPDEAPLRSRRLADRPGPRNPPS